MVVPSDRLFYRLYRESVRMVTNSGLLSPIVRAGAAVVFALVAIAVAATVWTVTYLSWWQAIGLESASFPATVVALVPLAGLG